MTKLESKKILIDKSVEEVYAFFSDFQNYKELMPSSVDRVDATVDTLEIGINKMGSLPMKVAERNENEGIRAVKNGNALFDFRFEVRTVAKGAQTELQMVLDADLNPMLKMMAQKPLVGFLDILVTNYQAKLV